MSDTTDLSSTEYETQRLQALASYQILDTPAESSFEEIAELASLICEAPIALVSLVDRERQWFKSEKGLGVISR